MTDSPFVGPVLVPISYVVLDGSTLASKGALDAQVIGAPDFKDDINAGWAELQISVGTNPRVISNLAYYDIIEITGNNGLGIGRWKYEKYTASERDKNTWQLNLMPLGKELTQVDYEANWTQIIDEDGLPPRQPTGFDMPVAEALLRTQHCHRRNLQSDGQAYDMQFRHRTARVVDTLNRGVDMGGPDWWWYCDGFGMVDMLTGPRYHHYLDYNRDIIWQDHGSDGTTTINCQCVYGGNLAEVVVDPATGLEYMGMVPIQVFVENSNPADPYSTVNNGRRVATVWRDQGVMSVATATKLGNNLLARHGAPISERTIYVRPGFEMIVPGDQVDITFPDEPAITNHWVKSRIIKGSTGVQQVTIASAIDFQERPFRARNGGMLGVGTLMQTTPLPPIMQIGSGGSGGGEIPFIHLPNAVLSGSGASTIVDTPFILDSSTPFLMRGIAQIDHTGAAGTYDLSIVGNGGLTIQCHETRDVAIDGKITIVLLTDVPLTDGDYSLVLQVAVAGAWTVAYDLQLDLFG